MGNSTEQWGVGHGDHDFGLLGDIVDEAPGKGLDTGRDRPGVLSWR